MGLKRRVSVALSAATGPARQLESRPRERSEAGPRERKVAGRRVARRTEGAKAEPPSLVERAFTVADFEVTRRGLRHLPERLRVMWLATRIDKEVRGGGVPRLLYNVRKYHISLAELRMGLELIGARHACDILRNAHEELHRDSLRRDAFYRSNFDDAPRDLVEALGKLSRQYKALEPPVQNLIDGYAQQHAAELERCIAERTSAALSAAQPAVRAQA
jgi:hypothetical protein